VLEANINLKVTIKILAYGYQLGVMFNGNDYSDIFYIPEDNKIL
jgi:hypothetical protein